MASSVVINEVSNSDSDPFEVIFIPWYANGHLIPMTDIATLFAARNIPSTILTTPANAALIQPTMIPIQTLLYPFPSSLSDLPPNAENIASVPPTDSHKFDDASLHSRPAIESLLRLRRPNAIIADVHFTWIFETAADLGIPFLVFHAIGLFPTAVMRVLGTMSHSDGGVVPFLIPGLPHDIRMVNSELPTFFRKGHEDEAVKDSSSIWFKLKEMEAKSFGFIDNSFSHIESEYADYFLNVHGKRCWLVGPVAVAASYYQNEQLAVRCGKVDDNNESCCLTWLDSQCAKSVVYVCFGSWCHFSGDQIQELALGLESCGHPFLWVVREDSVGFLPEGYEKRVLEGKKGLVVTGWVPQTAVLGHVSVGGFVTHCGWNSLLEGLAAGLPMVTWPLVFEQFINEKLVIDVLRVGMKCRKGGGSTVEEEKEVVRSVEVATAVRKIMSDEGAEMREGAEGYAVKAKEAVREGGSSYNALTKLIEDLKAWPGPNVY